MVGITSQQQSWLASRRRQMVFWAASLSGVLLTLQGLSHWLLLKLLYHPRRYEDEPGYARHIKDFSQWLVRQSHSLETLQYTCSDSKHHRAFLVRPKADSKVLWVMFGGNAMLAADWFFFVERLVRLQVSEPFASFLLVDYPGYGYNPGAPSPSAALDAAQQAVRAARGRPQMQSVSRVHLLGHSLGAACASSLAVELTADGESPGQLLLSAPFLNIPAMARIVFRQLRFFDRIPGWMINLLVRHHWDNAATVPKAVSVGWQLGLIHGFQDGICPHFMSLQLKEIVESNGGHCTLFESTIAGHNDILSTEIDKFAETMGFMKKSPL